MTLQNLRTGLLSVLLLTLFGLNVFASGNEGDVRFAMRTGSWFDPYTDNPSSGTQTWLRDHFWRMQSTSPYFDSRISWFPNAWVYLDLYGVPTDSALVSQHPDWFLKDGNGNLLYIPFDCGGGHCSQYAADPGNASFRSYWVSQTSNILKRGYKGVWIDDVNLAFRVGNGNGTQVAPRDPRTGQTMTLSNWEKYVADFTKYIRTSLPSTEIVHNSIWFAGANSAAYNDPYVIEEIQQANYIDCERGVSDPGLTGGTGFWSLNNFFTFVDHVHSLGKNTIFDEYKTNGEFGLAGYLLISNGNDAEADQSMTPNNWWAGYNVNLGAAQGKRYNWNNLLRRDFSGGMVLLNPPQSGKVTVTLPKSFQRISGSSVTSITLSAGQGAVLTDASASLAAAVRVDSGGSGLSDFAGDMYVSGGSDASFSANVTTSGVSNAAPEGVYQSKRTSFSNFTYTIPALTVGHTYSVRLHFADDLSSAAGQRVFNVSINGSKVLTNFDIFKAAGTKLKAVVEQFSAKPDANGEIVIQFSPTGKGAALISGIEIVP